MGIAKIAIVNSKLFQRRAIGFSFQQAIITPRLNLTGYDIAAAQSYSLI